MILHGYDSNVIMDVTIMIFQSYVGIKEYVEYELRCLDRLLFRGWFCLSEKTFFNGCTYQKKC